MKTIVSLVATVMLLIGTACGSKNVSSESNQEISTWMVGDINYAVFGFECVEDIIWSSDDGHYYIEYNDPDGFDLDNLAYLTNRNEWYGDFIVVDIPDELVQIFQDEYTKWTKSDWEMKYALSDGWCIKEVWICFEDGTKDVRFEMVHQSWESTVEE